MIIHPKVNRHSFEDYHFELYNEYHQIYKPRQQLRILGIYTFSILGFGCLFLLGYNQDWLYFSLTFFAVAFILLIAFVWLKLHIKASLVKDKKATEEWLDYVESVRNWEIKLEDKLTIKADNEEFEFDLLEFDYKRINDNYIRLRDMNSSSWGILLSRQTMTDQEYSELKELISTILSQDTISLPPKK